MKKHQSEFWSRYQQIRRIENSASFRAMIAEDAEGAQFVIYELDDARLPPTISWRIKYEAQRLAEIVHSHVIGPVEIDSSPGSFRLVCPSLPHTSLAEQLQQGLSVSEVLEIAADLLQILQSVHKAGLVLRCLRPSDVYLRHDGDSLRAFLGGCPPLMLLHGIQTIQSPAGMLTYGAPETLGALAHEIRAPADLYSLGILLFECLTGVLPFTGKSSGEMLFHHVSTPVPDLRTRNPEISSSLADIVCRLLQKHPRDRYQSAAGALFDVAHVQSVLSGEHDAMPSVPFVLGTKDHRESLIEPAFVGRRKELNALEAELDNALSGQSSAVLISASSGTGKSRLLREASVMATARGFRLLNAQGQNHVGLSPLATVQPALDACFALIHDDAEIKAALQDRMQDYASELHAVVPELAEELGIAAPDSRERELSDRRIAVALATLLGHVSTEERPVLLLLDDAQWADELTLSILECWQLTSPERTLLLVSSRPTNMLADRLQNHLKFAADFELTSLSRQDSDLLLESMAGTLPPEILDVVWGMASGSPFVSSAVLRGLVECDALISTDDGWTVDADQMHDLQMSGEAVEVLKQRLVRLPEDSRRLLAVGAVLGKSFSVVAAANLAGMSYETAVEHLAEPQAHHLVFENAADGVCQFAHDQIRDAVLESLSDDSRVEIHLAAARRLSETAPESYFEIACHYDAANCPDRALPAAEKAAASALRRHALEIAEQQFDIALRCCVSLNIEPSFEILSGMGDVLMLSGRYLEAQPVLEDALRYTDSAVAEAEIGLKLGELAFKRDDKDEAVELWESALRKLGGQLPADWLMPVFALKEIFVQTLHSLLPKFFVHSRNTEATLRDRLICRLYSRLAYGYWYLKGKLPLLYVHLRGMNLAEGFAPTAELAQAYSEHAPAMSLIPLSNRGIAYGQRSLQIRESLEDVWGQGQSLHFLAIALYAAGRFEECIDVGRRSVRILNRAGDFWEKHIAQYQVAASLFRMGRMTEAVKLARETYDSGLAVGDDQVCGNIIDIWARATNGDLPADVVQRELDRPRADVQGRAHVLLARGVQLMAEKRFTEATQAFADGIRVSRDAGITNCYTAPLYVWHAAALRHVLEEESPLIRRARQTTIVGHRRAAWRACLIALRFRSELPHALRELAWSFIYQNRVRRAMYLLKWSIQEARSQSAEYEMLQSELVLQQVRIELQGGDARVGLKDISARMSSFRNEQLPKRMLTSLSLVDRFDSLLESGRRIASAIDPEDIIDTTMAACQQLLRSDFCRVVPVDDDGLPQQLTESLRIESSRSIKSGEAVIAREPTRDFRSLMSCPVYARGSVVACLVVGNSEIRDLFGDDEIRIATYITAICGAALENAEGFRNLKLLNENLEKMVSERTAAVEARSHELQKTADNLRQTQVELAAARDAAELANQAKTEFLAQMSHEIRTPIGAVLGFTEILLGGDHPLHPEQRQHLTRVHSNGSHLLQLLNDLLDLSRIEAGEMAIERLPCDPFSLLSDVLNSLQSRAIDKGLKLTLEVRNCVPELISTDPTRLRQIITNLVGNAIKFTVHGGVELVLETVPENEQLRIHVHDSGVGIPAAVRESVFESFQQADVSVNRRFGGTGLGLPISRKLARALGGDITVDSEEGVGSTFTVSTATGPLDDVRMLSATEALENMSAPSTNCVTDVDLSEVRVLVADDIEANREFLRHMLQSAGARVDTVGNGLVAVECGKAHAFDIILMDMRMPVMDGYTAVRNLREGGIDVPIIALTANVIADDEIRCREAGCSGYLTKPISMKCLLQEIATQLGLLVTHRTEVFTRDRDVLSAANTADCSDTSDPLVLEPCDEIPEDPFLRKMSMQLLTQLERTLQALRDAAVNGEADALSDQAHWIKGTGATIGLPIITTLGNALDDAANRNDFDSAGATVDELAVTVQRLKSRLERVGVSESLANSPLE